MATIKQQLEVLLIQAEQDEKGTAHTIINGKKITATRKHGGRKVYGKRSPRWEVSIDGKPSIHWLRKKDVLDLWTTLDPVKIKEAEETRKRWQAEEAKREKERKAEAARVKPLVDYMDGALDEFVKRTSKKFGGKYTHKEIAERVYSHAYNLTQRWKS